MYSNHRSTGELVKVKEVVANPRGAVSGPFGSDISKKFYRPDGVPVIRGNNLSSGSSWIRFVDNGYVFLSENKAKELSSSECLPGDLVFTARGTIGQVGLIPINSLYPRYIASANQLRLRVDHKKANSLYLYYWFRSEHMLKTMISNSTSTGVPNLNLATLKNLPIWLPSLQRQEEISSILDNIDSTIEQTEYMVTYTEQLRNSLLCKLLVKGLPGYHTKWNTLSNLGTFPDTWQVVRLCEVSSIGAGDPAPQDSRYYEGGIYPFVRTQDVGKAKLSRNFWKTKDNINDVAIKDQGLHLWPKDTILMPKSGASILLNHRVRLSKPAYVSSHLATILPHDNISSLFLYYTLCQQDISRIIRNPGYPSLSLEDISSVRLALPPLNEQLLIAKYIESIDNVIEAGQSTVHRRTGVRQSLLYELMIRPFVEFDKTELL